MGLVLARKTEAKDAFGSSAFSASSGTRAPPRSVIDSHFSLPFFLTTAVFGDLIPCTNALYFYKICRVLHSCPAEFEDLA